MVKYFNIKILAGKRGRMIPHITNWESIQTLATTPSTYSGAVMLFIALTLISMPDMPSNTKDFLMVAFACTALMPGLGRV